jgi:hypothetical protein
LATFVVDDKPATLCFFITGCEVDSDRAAPVWIEELFTMLLRPPSPEISAGLRSILERPAVICIPCSTATSERDTKRLSQLSVCLGVAFFEKAMDYLMRINAGLDRLENKQRLKRHGGSRN